MSKVATAEDFRRKAEEQSLGIEEELTLPSGLVIKVRRPTPLWWITHRGILPSRMAAMASGNEVSSTMSNEDLVEWSKFVVTLMETVVISPRIRPNPGPDEVDPNLIQLSDMMTIIRYAGGEIMTTGQSLDTFRGRSGSTDSRPGRSEVVYPSESDLEPQRGNGLAN